MRGKDLLECMEQIDDALVEEALDPAAFPRRKITASKWGMAAACAVVLAISATVFWPHQNGQEAYIDDQDSGAADTAAPPLAEDTAATNDTGGGNTAAASVQDGSTMTAGASEGAEGSAVSGDKEHVRQNSAEDAAASKEGGVETAKSEELKDGITETESLSYTVISDYYGEKDDFVYDYPIPEKGEFFCYHYLQETMKYYAALEDVSGIADSSVNISEMSDSPIYAYDVVINIYGDVEKDGEVICCELENTNDGNEKIEQEYRRLIDLGYAVRLSEDFQLTGTFSKVELDTFQASPEYGYTFRFASEY